MSSHKDRLLDSQLTYEVLRKQPIWTHYDWDCSEVVPVEYPGWNTEAIGGEVIFLLGNLLLHDGTLLAVRILFQTYREKVFSVNVLSDQSKDIWYPFEGPFKGSVTKEAFASLLGKNISQVFPMRYETPFVYTKGALIAGVIE